MKLKNFFFYLIAISLCVSLTGCPGNDQTTGCKDPTATNYEVGADVSCSGCCTYAPKQGGVLFWTNSPTVISTCGNILITISNGKQTLISGYYINTPVNCVNQVGGYVLLDVGTYQYTITSNFCGTVTRTLTVVEGCNRVQI